MLLKKRNLSVFLLCPLLFAACHQNNYKIVGTVEGLNEGDTLFLSNNINTSLPSDTMIIKKGGFSLKGHNDSVVLGILYAPGKPEVITPLFLESGTIHIHLSDKPQQISVSGTNANNALQEANTIAYLYGEKMKEIVRLLSETNINEESGLIARYQLENLKREMTDKILKIAENNLDNEFGYLIIANLDDNESMPAEQRLRLIKKMPKKFQERPAIKTFLLQNDRK